MIVKKEYVTPYLIFIFLVLGMSGILMFFHILDDFTKVVHEFLGLLFILFVMFHVILNWKNIKNYFYKRELFVPCIIILMIAIGLAIIGKINGNLEDEILKKFVTAPVSDSLKIINIDYNKAKTILEKNNILIKNTLESIEEISTNNQKSPEEIIELLMK